MNPPTTEDSANDLPDNVSGCHKLINELRAEMKALQEQVAELKKQVGRRNRMLFGKKSAKVSNTVLTGTGKAIYDADQEELDAEKTRLEIVSPEQTHGGGGRTAPDNASTEDSIEHEITDPSALACPCCGRERKVMGFRVSHQLDILKAVFKRLKHIQYTYGCPRCNTEIVTAPKPEQPFGKGYATGGLVAHTSLTRNSIGTNLSIDRNRSIVRRAFLSVGRPCVECLKMAPTFSSSSLDVCINACCNRVSFSPTQHLCP